MESVEEVVRANEKDLDIIQQKNAELIKAGQRYRELVAIQESGQKLTHKQEYEKELAEMSNVEWSYDAIEKEMDQIIEKQITNVKQLDIWKEKLRINQAEYDGIIKKAEEYKSRNKCIIQRTKTRAHVRTSASGERQRSSHQRRRPEAPAAPDEPTAERITRRNHRPPRPSGTETRRPC